MVVFTFFSRSLSFFPSYAHWLMLIPSYANCVMRKNERYFFAFELSVFLMIIKGKSLFFHAFSELFAECMSMTESFAKH